MNEERSIIRSITIRKDQDNFIRGERFNLSRFVQMKLDEWIKFKKESEQFKKEVGDYEKE